MNFQVSHFNDLCTIPNGLLELITCIGWLIDLCKLLMCTISLKVWWSASDLGWVVGHSYICYAPLLNGNTTIVYEVSLTKSYTHIDFYSWKINECLMTIFSLRIFKKYENAGFHTFLLLIMWNHHSSWEVNVNGFFRSHLHVHKFTSS